MIKKLVLAAAIALTPAPVSANTCKPILDMQPSQRATLQQSYDYGEPYGMGYSLAAIGWQESQAGLYPLNLSDPSVGVHHILLKTAMKREGIKNTSFGRNVLAAKLLDHDVSAGYAIQELEYWETVHKGDWNKIWASYNAGHKYKNGLKYSSDIKHKVRLLQKCVTF